MSKIQFTSNFGNFDYRLTMDVADVDRQVANILVEALANLGFRACGSNVEKALVKAGAMSKDDKRNAAEYSEANAEVLRKAAQATLAKIGEEQGYPTVSIEVIGQHVFGADTPTKEASELWEKVVAMDADAQALALERLGVEDITDEAAGVAACKKVLQQAKKDAAAAAKNALGVS